MKYSLRDYQNEAVNRMLWGVTLDGNSLVCVAQGGGKSVIIAEFAKRLNAHILILVPNKELLKQNLEKLSAFVDKEDVGVYSASMKSKEIKIND